MKKNFVKLLLSIFCAVLFAIPVFAGDVNLSAAMSLKDVMAELTSTFSKNNPGINFQTNLGSSGALAKQLASGAPADMYFSANIKWMNFLNEKKLVDNKYNSIMAYNTLVFVGKPDLTVKKIQDVVKLNKISIGSPSSVPAGDYADKALVEAGIKDKLTNKLVMAKDVRTCLLYADKGEVDGAFVYRTDAEEMAKNVKILFVVPQKLYPRITYPMAITVSGSKNSEAIAFYNFLKTKEAQGILVKHGFSIK